MGKQRFTVGDKCRAFTLVELLVAMVLLAVITTLVLQITDDTSKIWRSSTDRIQTFQEARAAFDSMTRNLSQATLNTYYDYYDSSNQSRLEFQKSGGNTADFVPASYDRISELHFISGDAATLLAGSPDGIVTQTHAVFFQAPLGYSVAHPQIDTALNACGYFLQFDDADAFVPGHVRKTPGFQPRHRFRLMEMKQETEEVAIYDPATISPSGWFVDHAGTSSRVIAENVIALILLPKLAPHEDSPDGAGGGVSLAPHYNYNSRIGLGDTSDEGWSSGTPPFPPDAFTAYPADGSETEASRHHQLPPMMQVIMIVLDEASAARIQGDATTPPSAINLSQTSLFSDGTKLEADLQAVEDILNAEPGNLTGNSQKLTYRIFNTGIIMREAKWSND